MKPILSKSRRSRRFLCFQLRLQPKLTLWLCNPGFNTVSS